MGATKSELLIKRYSTVADPGDSETSKSFFGNVFGLLKQTFQEWLQDKAPQLGAALAYYTVFSLAPLILVLLAVVGVIFRDDPGGAWNKITQQMSYFLDANAVQVVQNIAQQASQPGKSTIATRVHQELERRGVDVEYIDGDALRDVFPATGFTREEREEHLRRTGYMASPRPPMIRRIISWLAAHGVTVVASFVSPYRASREFIRRLCPGFLEIFVATPLDECERRDVKGLYARARRGEIRNFTGIDDPYEPPDHPELTLDTRALSVDQCVDRVLDRLGGDR